MEKVMTMDFDEAMRQPAPPQRGREPLFNVSVTLYDAKPIPVHEIKKVVCEDFILPPRGHSKESDFDLLCHLELEPEKAEKVVMMMKKELPNQLLLLKLSTNQQCLIYLITGFK
jgi:hypothetical protein